LKIDVHRLLLGNLSRDRSSAHALMLQGACFLHLTSVPDRGLSLQHCRTWMDGLCVLSLSLVAYKRRKDSLLSSTYCWPCSSSLWGIKYWKQITHLQIRLAHTRRHYHSKPGYASSHPE